MASTNRFGRFKYIGLQILERLITTRWKTLPDQQRQGMCTRLEPSAPSHNLYIEGIRNFIVGVTVKVASDEVSLKKEKTYINKLNLALVQVRIVSILCRLGVLTIPSRS